MPDGEVGKAGAKKPWLMIAAVLLFCIDLAFKRLAERSVLPPAEGIAAFSLFRNPGIAFSIPVSDLVYWPASLFLLLLMVAGFLRAIRENDTRIMELHVFILLGSASNLWDRLMKGAVTDYFIFFQRSAINIADFMIMGAIAVLVWRDYRRNDLRVKR